MPYKSITETFFFMCVVWALQLVRDVPETKKKMDEKPPDTFIQHSQGCNILQLLSVL
jgi:hypothetical protein